MEREQRLQSAVRAYGSYRGRHRVYGRLTAAQRRRSLFLWASGQPWWETEFLSDGEQALFLEDLFHKVYPKKKSTKHRLHSVQLKLNL